MRYYDVQYQIATYSGTETVCFNDEYAPENDEIISKAKNQLRRKAGGSLPFGYESYKITDCRQD